MLSKSQSVMHMQRVATKDVIQADAPNVFIGHHGYPKVNVGFLTPAEKQPETWRLDAPRVWATEEQGIPEIIQHRSSLINSRFLSGIQETGSMIQKAQEVSMAVKPVDLDVSFSKRPHVGMHFDTYALPSGPSAFAGKVDITSNPRIPTAVEKVVSDIDLRAGHAVATLHSRGFDEHYLTKLLSMGNIGKKQSRKLVPTRWSITAVDDTLGKQIAAEILDYEKTGPRLQFGGYLGNYFMILLFNRLWSYELFEMYTPQGGDNGTMDGKLEFTTDYEMHTGRKEYAKETVGGYYAARLSILEALQAEKRQATCIVLRFITDEYACPLGVWVVREAVRKAMQSKQHRFTSEKQMLAYGLFIAQRKFNFRIDRLLKHSALYKYMQTQKILRDFK